ncbi:MAG: metallophosphoesterase family protein [Magnetococcales bacterium]|nr:metallophosphoesterase family protein [Magnetococcales bacterium]
MSRFFRVWLPTLLLSLILLWAGLVEPRWIVLRQLNAHLKNWPQDRTRVAILSDFHIGSIHMDTERLDRLVARVNREQPDLVLFLGDFTYSGDVRANDPARMEEIATILGHMEAPLGRYAVLGNADARFEPSRLTEALLGHGIHPLKNENRRIQVNSGAFHLAGVNHPFTGGADLNRSLAGITPGQPVLLMTHDPEMIKHLNRENLFALAGHTHGGQVRLPGMPALVMASDLPRSWAWGLIRHHAQWLFVTAGLGTEGVPLRFLRFPEWVLMTISPGDPDASLGETHY